MYYYDLSNALKNISDATHLYLSAEKKADLSRLPELENLELLDLSYFSEAEFPTNLASLPKLEKLVIRGKLKQIPESIFELKNLKSLHLQYSYLPSISPKLSELENLESLFLKNTTFKTLPIEICQLSNLQILDLENSLLESLPPEIAQLQNLLTLNLSNTKLKTLPWEFALLNASNIYLGFTPFFEKLGQSQKKIAELFKQFQKYEMSAEQRKLYFQIFLGNWDEISYEDNAEIILEGLNSANQIIRLNTLAFLSKRKPNPFFQHVIDEPWQIFIVGRMQITDKDELISKLAEQNIFVSTRFDNSVNYLVVGENPKNALKTALQKQIPIISANHLADYWRSLSDYYLSKTDEDTLQMAKNLKNLLKSEEEANRQLGLEMALGGGINEVYFYDLLLLYLWNPHTLIKNLAEKVLKKFLPAELFMHLKNNSKNWYRDPSEDAICTYLQNIDYQGINIDQLALLFYKQTDRGKRFCLQQAQAFIEVCMKEKKYNVLALSNLKLENLHSNIAQFPFLKMLYLQNNLLKELPSELEKLQKLQVLNLQKNRFAHFPEVILQLSNLNELNLANNKLSTLPDNLLNLNNLHSLNLQKNKIKNLPENIIHLKNLRVLNLQENPLSNSAKELLKTFENCQVLS